MSISLFQGGFHHEKSNFFSLCGDTAARVECGFSDAADYNSDNGDYNSDYIRVCLENIWLP